MIAYFSGTGNSRFVAEKLSQRLKDPVVSLNGRIKAANSSPLHSDADWLFVFPVYCGRMPKIVERHLLATDFSGSRNAYFIGTCAHIAGDIEPHLKRLCGKNGWNYSGFQAVFMPQNHVALYDAAPPEKARETIGLAIPAIERAGETIRRGERFPRGSATIQGFLLSSVEYPVFYRLFLGTGKFHSTSECVGCGRCAALCPLNNITIDDGKPAWGRNCTHCMACIGGCPKAAVEYGRRTHGKPRYYCNESPKDGGRD